jgi:hypothetical protein
MNGASMTLSGLTTPAVEWARRTDFSATLVNPVARFGFTNHHQVLSLRTNTDIIGFIIVKVGFDYLPLGGVQGSFRRFLATLGGDISVDAVALKSL